MIRKITLSLIVILGCYVTTYAQFCGFDQKHQQLLSQDPTYAQKVQQMNNQLTTLLQSNSNSLIVNTPNGPVYQIPVVIHVVHTGGAVGSIYNPTDNQLIGMISYLNQAYSATYVSYPNANNGGTYIPLQFALAKRTPTCAATNGIVRVNGSSVTNYVSGGVDNGSGTGANEVDVKNLSRWPNDLYYNIWVVNKINGQDGTSGTFTAGYAYFPGAGAAVDGTIMLATQAVAGEITLPHEIGHAFALYHTFQGDAGGGTCPTNANCATDGDMVCDTDPHKRSVFNCPTGTNPCTGTPYGTVVHNFMDYSSCQDRFTPGQKTRVINALFNSRASLISSLGGTALPTTPIPSACVPTITNPTNTSNSGPRLVKISDASTTYMSVSSSGYSGDGNIVYVDNTCKHQVELIAGNTYNFAVQTGFNAENGLVYVDYNNDGAFQANEQVQAWTTSTPNQTYTFSYTVPTTATIPGLVSCIPLRMRVITDRTISAPLTVCGPVGYGQAEDYSLVIKGGGPTTGSATVGLTSGTNPSCFNSPLAFVVVPGAGITSATFVWYLNGNSTGVTGNTYSSSTLNHLDILKAKMYFTGLCGQDSAWSNDYTVFRQNTIPPTVSIALLNGTIPGCANQTVSFKATPTNGGTTPSYQWKVNGVNAGFNVDTFGSVFNNNDVVTVDMTSSSACASPTTATSNSITVTQTTITADVTIAQNEGTNPSCAGRQNGFEAQTVNAGVSPQFQWILNGVSIPGATNAFYSSTTFVDNDEIKVVMNSNDPCVNNPSDTSNTITININPNDTPLVNINITAGSNPGCLDSLIEFTADITHHGANPNLTWFVNSFAVSNSNIYSSNTLNFGDTVILKSVANDGSCYTKDTVFSEPIVMALYATPASPLISFIGTLLVSNLNTTTVWYGPNGVISGANGQTFAPTIPGQYYARVSNNGCLSKPSNVLTISINDIATYDLSQVKIFPNPTSGYLTLDWGTKTVTASLDVYNVNGQGLMHEKVTNQNSKTLDLTRLANGVYFILIRDDSGKVGTIKINLFK